MKLYKVAVSASGNVYVNDECIAQLCFDGDAIGSALAQYINDTEDSDIAMQESLGTNWC